VTDTYPDDEQPSSIDPLVVSDRATFWAAIHRMSSASYVPTRSSGVLTVPNTQGHVAASRSASQKRWGWRPL
jgi:hypothetical protein